MFQKLETQEDLPTSQDFPLGAGLPLPDIPFGLPSPEDFPAPEGDRCSRICPYNYQPVCGSDGVTYTNECTFQVASCKDPNLSLEGTGFCASISLGTPAFSPPPPSPPLGELPKLDDTPGSGVIPFPPETDPFGGDFGGEPAVFEPLLPSPAEGCPEACTKIYDPLCGTDGVTYNNKCLFEIAVCKGSTSGLLLSVASDGPCGSALSPADPSILDSVDLRVPEVPTQDTNLPSSSPTTGVCKEECNRIYQPACGTDSVTYNNLCLLELASCNNVNSGGYAIKVDYEGPCVASDTAIFVSAMTPRPPTPTSFGGSAGDTGFGGVQPHSDTSFGASGGDTTGFGGFQSHSDTSLGTSGGDTTGFGGFQSHSDTSLGASGGDTTGFGGAQPHSDSSFGASAGVTSFGGAQPHSDSSFGASAGDTGFGGSQPHSEASFGSSGGDTGFTQGGGAAVGSFGGHDDGSPLSSCPQACTKIFSPVCGSDDQTYNNDCLLNVAACQSRSARTEAIFKVFDGPCVAVLPRGPACDESCDKSFVPVCGSDGETYNNICLLNVANCLNPFASITHVSDGPCEASTPPRLSTDPRPSISTEARPDIDITGTHGGAVHGGQQSQSPNQEYIPPV
ncbi:uncharacterized protein LOC135219204 [Macrobrachium nipponense]|uniref:uncharacterized protein LOC135219204 n=1 Tax=Macrobrachium nipponense TaxID=159736 RepID=UPI0030C7CD69